MTPINPSPTFRLRERLCDIARAYDGKVEASKNTAPWIGKLWTATNYPDGMKNREPYCAAGVAWCVREWLKDPDVLAALKLSPEAAEKWRCKSSSVFKSPGNNWKDWAEKVKGPKVQILPKNCILHAGDIVIYSYSHIEIVTNDDNTETGPFVAFGFNTDAGGSRDGEGAFEKPRQRKQVMCFIRILA